MIGIRMALILLVFSDVTSVPWLSNESKKDLDESRKSLTAMKSHIEKTIVTLENGFKKQIGVMKGALNTVRAKILKLDKALQVLGKDFKKTKWHKYDGHCYFYSPVSDQLDWFSSEKKCRGIGGYIIKIGNKEELARIAANRPDKNNYWIGMTDVVEGQFRWSFDQTRLTMLSNWYPSYGGSNRHNNNCGALAGSSTKWFDYTCTQKYQYICESNFCF